MSVTGLKTVHSLAIYQEAQDKIKEAMASILCQAMHKNDPNLQKKQIQALKEIPAPPSLPAPPVVENKNCHSTI